MNDDILTIPEEKRKRGRPKGVPNRSTKCFKEAIQAATESFVDPQTGKTGAQAWFEFLRDTDHKAFATLQGKIIPAQITTVDSSGKSAPLQLAITLKKPE
jgi:hypothetical protein